MSHQPTRPLRSLALLAAATAMVVGLAACGASKDKAPSQAAARVNKGEITVHQINQVLEQQRGLRPEQVDGAGREVLERLIDQELAVQKAEEQKLDRQPRVVAAIEAAKREIVARAYLEKLGESTPKPTADEVLQYFNGKPALFANRRIYSFQDLAIEVPAERRDEVKAQIASAKSLNALGEWLTAEKLRVSATQSTQAAESLPLALVDSLASLNAGQALVLPTATGLRALWVLAVRPAPVTLEQARPAVEQFILNDRRRTAALAAIKDLRAASKIEYLGKFAEQPAAASAAAKPGAPDPVAPSPAAPAPAASAGIDEATLKKGLGLK